MTVLQYAIVCAVVFALIFLAGVWYATGDVRDR
jgi:hypothetical protein